MKNTAKNASISQNDLEQIDFLALEVLKKERVAIFIVAYNASEHIAGVLKRIPAFILENLAQIYLIDDSSKDNTVGVAAQIEWPIQYTPLKIFKTPFNQGYGGNQKIGYTYANEEGFDIVVLLHGDGQYAPEALPLILAQYSQDIDAVFGSRFMTTWGALKGGMPIYKFFGNRVLTGLQNYFMKSTLSEWHSGYRSYRTRILKRVPFSCNSNDFDFDSEIIIQILGSGGKIREVPIPTFYGNEICHVNGLKYAAQCIKNVLQYRAMQFELFYDPRFDLQKNGEDLYQYTKKTAKTSLHHYVRHLPIATDKQVLDFGGGDGRAVADDLANKGLNITVIDQYTNSKHCKHPHFQLDLDSSWSLQLNKQFDVVLALDVIEHLKDPELGLQEIAKVMKTGALLYASTGNVAFAPLRFMLALGFFNYGRKGILDKTHKRLFTLKSFKRLLQQGGFTVIEEAQGFGPPIHDLTQGNSWFLRHMDYFAYCLAKWLPSLFAYQFIVTAKKDVTLRSLLEQTTGK